MKTLANDYKAGYVLIVLLVLGIVVCPADAGLWIDPNSFDVNTVEGTVLEESLTIGNDGIEDLDFIIRTRQVGGSGESAGGSDNGTDGKNGGILSVPKGHDFTVVGDVAYEPGRLIVRFAPTARGKILSTVDKNQILSPLGGGTVKRDFKIVPGLSVVQLPAGMTVEEALVVFNSADGILYAEPDYEVQICSTFPDDTRFDDLWGMHNTGQTGGTEDADIDAPEAWDIGTGSDEIIVAVIDTGVDYTHIDLAANIWVNEAEYNGTPGQDDDGNGYVDDIYGYDFRNNDGDPMDDHYHGTHCAGTVGAVGNNGEGVAGVCWNVRIMAVKFLSSGGSGTTADAISSVEYSTLMGANLSSNSWGGSDYSQGLKDAIDAAGAAGMLFVAAAGNDNENTDVHPHYPSSYDCESLISVMSTNKYDNKSGFSNWGPVSVDLGAPGSDILSCEPGSSYQYLSGTSMATPHVAGACALMWSTNPTMSNEEVKDILLQTVDETLSGLCVSQGRLNVYSAILETRAPWIEIEPQEGTIGPNSTVDVNVTFDAVELVPGAYEAEIVIISNDPCSPTIVPVTMTVNPDDLVVSPDEDFESSGTRGGPFMPECMTYTLTNNGTAPVNWTASETEDWLEVEPNEGVLEPNDSIDVDVCITSDANLLDPNIYDQILIFENTDSNSIKLRLVTLIVKPPDLFTELFDTNDNDLDYTMLTFMPDGSAAYYEACREKVDEFPTDPNGGRPVSLGDDDFAEVVMWLPWRKILFYGERYRRFYIGSNGYITFGDGDMQFSPSLQNHFNMPRISGLFADLSPSDNISYKKLSDRVAVTFQDVWLFSDKTATNSFQIEMFLVDGTIRITYLNLAAAGGVAGLSEGYGLPPFFLESNLSEYVPCWPCGDFDRDYSVDFKDFAMFAMHWLDENCGIPYWCEKTDLDFSSTVDIYDLDIFAENWLTVEDWWLQPVSHWKFDEGSGTTAYDSAGNNDGTIFGATWTTGQIGSALSFDGINNYVDVGDPGDGSLDFGTADFTLSAWFKTSISAPGFFVCKRAKGYYAGYDFYIQQEGRIFARIADGWSVPDARTTEGFNDGLWHHAAAVYDRDGVIRIYVDGVSKATSGSIKWIGNVNNSEPFTIGDRNDPGHHYYFDGTIDDVRIYDRALSAEEIEELYHEGVGNKAFNPNPTDGATGVDPNTVFSWSPGKDAASHDVYLGIDYNDVNDANTSSPEYKGNQDVNSYDPCGLDLLITYYWRIDEVSGPSVWKGEVWSFTTWGEPNSHLVSWWKFDEGEGTIAYDSAGNNDGTIYGATWTSGQIDGALDFDGTGDYVNVGNDNSLDVDAFTISAWVYRRQSGKNWQTIIDKSGGSSSNGGYALYVDADDKVNVFLADGAAPSPRFSTSNSFPISTWVHVVATFNGGVVNSGDIKVYYNAIEQSGTEYNYGTSLKSNTRNVYIGTYQASTGTTGKWNGMIDDVRIYDRALSAEEIWQLYQSGL